MATKLGALITSLVAQHIDDPTHEMRVAFRKLPTAHKWLLYTILEAGDRPSFLSKPEDMKTLETRFNALCPSHGHRSFDAVLEETSEGFVQIVREKAVSVGVTWIHPSCQDLTIEELASSTEDRRRFLRFCTRDGIEKALSVAGGSEGKRMLPLLTTDDDWTCLTTRCTSLLSEGDNIVSLLLRSLSSLQSSETENRADAIEKITRIIVALWSPYLNSVRRKPNWSWPTLTDFFKIRRIAKRTERPPRLRSFWEETVDDLLTAMEGQESIEEADATLYRFYRIACLLARYEAKAWNEPLMRNIYRKALEGISTRAQTEIDSSYYYSHFDADDLERASRAQTELSEQFKELTSLPDLDEEFESKFQEAAWHFDSCAEELSEKAKEKSQRDENTNTSAFFEAATEIEGRSLTLAKLFEDL